MRKDSGQRKRDHLDLTATDQVRFQKKTTLLEQVELIHRALPELALHQVDLSGELWGKTLSAPLWVSAMTGGTDQAARLNQELAAVAQQLGIGFCLGSLSPFLDDPDRRADFALRRVAPDLLLLGNIGGVELARRGPEPILVALQQIQADGVTVHLNPAMELIQPGGDTDFCEVAQGIARLIEHAPDLPVVVKETGCGLSWKDGELLRQAGVAVVETGGAGGTSWVGVETLRAEGVREAVGRTLWDWGIPTAASIAWMKEQGFEVVAGGGIRTGLDLARAIALGARLAGVAAPLVRAHKQGGAAQVRDLLQEMITGLRYTMLLVGAANLEELQQVPRLLGPELTQWIVASPGPGPR